MIQLFKYLQAEKEDLEEDKKAKIEQAKETLKEAFEIPDDETLKVSRNLELIFLQNNRREIPVPVSEEIKEEENESVCLHYIRSQAPV